MPEENAVSDYNKNFRSNRAEALNNINNRDLFMKSAQLDLRLAQIEMNLHFRDAINRKKF